MILRLVQSGRGEQKRLANGALLNLAGNDEACTDIACCGGIEALVTIVQGGDDIQKEAAVSALQKIAVSGDNFAEVKQRGEVAVLSTCPVSSRWDRYTSFHSFQG